MASRTASTKNSCNSIRDPESGSLRLGTPLNAGSVPGSVEASWLVWVHFTKCGSRRRSSMNTAPILSRSDANSRVLVIRRLFSFSTPLPPSLFPPLRLVASFLLSFFETMIGFATGSLRSKVRLYLWRSCTFLDGLSKTNVDFINLKVELDRRFEGPDVRISIRVMSCNGMFILYMDGGLFA